MANAGIFTVWPVPPPTQEVPEPPLLHDLPAPVVDAVHRARGALIRTVYRWEVGGRSIVALGYHRPTTAQEKLTAVTGPSDLLGGLLDAVVGSVSGEPVVSVKLELPFDAEDEEQIARAHGFVSLRAPVEAAPVPHDTQSVPRGLVFRIGGWSAPELAYYRQTTEFTCGPVAVLTGLHAVGTAPVLNREAELALWREATSVPACDPFGLAVGLVARGAQPEVIVSTTEPLFLEDATAEWQSDMRRFMQDLYRRQALDADVSISVRQVHVSEIAERVRAGEIVVVLIDELVMHAEACPHWVVVHAVVGDVFLVEDPWTDAEFGESWVDAHELPITTAGLEKMALWGDPAYSSAVVVGSRPAAS